jgi:signal transduction histidine kinase
LAGRLREVFDMRWKGVDGVPDNHRAGTIAFAPRARLLKLIGEELISDEVVAISELVKNAHDADSEVVTLCFRGVTGPDGQIEVRDDGCGMDVDTLLGRWMEPAASTKVGKGRQITRRGWRVLGEKGVGRFAADKLARHLEVISRCARKGEELVAHIDWDCFDTDSLMLSEVLSRWERRRAREIKRHGTLLRMRDLRSPWSERMFRRLCIRLARLLSPFRQKDRFGIHIESDEFPEYSGELRADFLERAPYQAEAEFDGEQTISLALNGRRPVSQKWNGQGDLSCGPLRIRLFAFDLEGESLARLGPRMEVRAWLREWSGVSIYRDGFRVWPYGEPHDDWLRLDQRRVNNPVEHLSNNQVIGFIDIGRDRNPDLMDQTNREGLIHNPAFEDLRRLLYFVLQAIEAERQSIRHPQRGVATAAPEAQSGVRSVISGLERLASKMDGENARELRKLVQGVRVETGKGLSTFQQMMEGCTGLAATGQLVTSFADIIPHELSLLQKKVDQVRELIGGINQPELRDTLSSMGLSLATLNQFYGLMLGVAGNGERRRAIDLVAETRFFHDLMSSVLESRGVRMEVLYEEREVLRTEMRPENYHGVLQILTSNALDWLSGRRNPRIRIHLSGNREACTLIFSDSGPGIPLQYSSRVFDPLFSRKEGGRGMGLSIARQVVETHGGKINVLIDGRRSGANFQLLLPRKRSRATVYTSTGTD